MEQKTRPLILISNDDGYQSNGLRTLVTFLNDMADIIVCAPTGGRSGYSRAFSATEVLSLERQDDILDAEVWACSGTPVDCVKIAWEELLQERKPDLIIGGINHGDNSTVNNHYSGTMGVAMEGCMKYVPSIAFSTCDYRTDADLSYLRDYVRSITARVLRDGLPKGVCLNVNFPVTDGTFAGLKLCRMGFGQWVNEIEKRTHPYGRNYYWMVGEYRDDEPGATDNDRWALAHGYVAVTPTKLDVTDYEMMARMRDWETM